jgi:hypothetical protein
VIVGPLDPWSLILGLVAGEAVLLGFLWAVELWERRAKA